MHVFLHLLPGHSGSITLHFLSKCRAVGQFRCGLGTCLITVVSVGSIQLKTFVTTPQERLAHWQITLISPSVNTRSMNIVNSHIHSCHIFARNIGLRIWVNIVQCIVIHHCDTSCSTTATSVYEKYYVWGVHEFSSTRLNTTNKLATAEFAGNDCTNNG